MRISLLTTEADLEQAKVDAFCATAATLLFDEVVRTPGFYYTPAVAKATGDWCLIATPNSLLSPEFVAALRAACSQAEREGVDGLRVIVHYCLNGLHYHTAREWRAFKHVDYITIPPRPCAGIEGLTKGVDLDQQVLTCQRQPGDLRQERAAHLRVVHDYLRNDPSPHDRYLAELALRIEPHLLETAGEEAFLPDKLPLTSIKGISPRRARMLALAGVETPQQLVNVSAEYLEQQIGHLRGVSLETIVRWQNDAFLKWGR